MEQVNWLFKSSPQLANKFHVDVQHWSASLIWNVINQIYLVQPLKCDENYYVYIRLEVYNVHFDHPIPILTTFLCTYLEASGEFITMYDLKAFYPVFDAILSVSFPLIPFSPLL